jgi:hypothetical protein
VAPPTRHAQRLGRNVRTVSLLTEHLGARAAVAVALVHEAAADRAGAAVHVLVGTPDGEIAAPVVKVQWHITRRVREVETHLAALRVASLGDPRHVEQLPGVVLNTAEHNQRNACPLAGNDLLNILRAQQCLSLAGRDLEHRTGRVIAVQLDLRGDGVMIGGERFLLQKDLEARRCGAVERRHHHVQVAAETVHHDDFAGQATNELRHRIRHNGVDVHPRRRFWSAVKVAHQTYRDSSRRNWIVAANP